MSTYPARERAVAYLRRKGTEAPPESVRAGVTATLSKLETILESIDQREATRKPDPETWCVQEVVDHLTVSLELAIEKLRALREGESTGEAIPVGLIGEDACDRAWSETVARLRAAHRSFLSELERVPDDLSLERTARVVMEIKVEDADGERRPLVWTERLDWKSLALVAHVHTLEHVDQIGRILECIRRSA